MASDPEFLQYVTEQLSGVYGLSHRKMFGEYALYYDNPNLVNTRAQNYQKITAADVQRVAAKYLTKENRSVVVTMPKAAPAGAPKGGQQ